MNRHWLAILGTAVLLVLITGNAACAIADAAPVSTDAGGQFAVGFDPFYLTVEFPGGFGLHLAYYTQFGLFAEVCGGTDSYGEDSVARFVLGYNYRRDETVEYFVALGALKLDLDVGQSLNPAVFFGYHTSRFLLGPPGEYVEVPNLWHSYYLGYAFDNRASGGNPDLGNFFVIGCALEYRF